MPLTMTTVVPLLVFMVSGGLNLKQKWNYIVLFVPWVIFYDRTILLMALTRKVRFSDGKNDQNVLFAQENVSTTLALTDARVIPDTVDGTALLTLTNATRHLAKMVSK